MKGVRVEKRWRREGSSWAHEGGADKRVPRWRAVIVLPGARALTITTHALFCMHVTASLKALKGADGQMQRRKGGERVAFLDLGMLGYQRVRRNAS